MSASNATATGLLSRALRWMAHDPDSATRDELGELIGRVHAGAQMPLGGDPKVLADAHAAVADLADRFSGPLLFGTAGLRGVLGAGESRMNRAVVLRTTAGLASYLLGHDADRARLRGVVVGYDGRRLGRQLAEDTACVLAAAGIRAHLSPVPCPTPLTAYAVTKLGAAAGVMVTASHNPPEYNGYKVYAANGAQIIPPADEAIARAIEKAPFADQVPRMELADARLRGLVVDLSPELDRSYLDAVRALSVRPDGDRTIGIVYTPLHGVGNRLTRLALAEAGFTRVVSVPEQAEPDGAFPTVAFPNPEEKGALDLAYALARREGAKLVLANDPDVDRLAIAVGTDSASFVQLTGNQVGVLLGHYLLTQGPGASGERVVLASCVSSPMLGCIAKELGVRYEETLTGFKWIANRAMELERTTGVRFVFGYEEALGYTVGTVVRDKDGIGAAVIAAELAAVLHASGKTLLDELESLARRFGLFASAQRSVTLPGADGIARMGAVMDRLRASPPSRIGAFSVEAVRDHRARVRTTRDGGSHPIELPPTNMIAFELEGGSRIIARPSGTEPKIKFYFDLREPMREGEPLRAAEERASARIAALATAFCAIAGVG